MNEYPYICEKCKAAPVPRNGFPRAYRWKTERGFANHKCYKGKTEDAAKRAEAKRKRAEREAAREAERQRQYDVLMAERLATAKHRVGETVHVAMYIVTQPTHRTNGFGRSVRIRYEEGRRYEARTVTIQRVTLYGYYDGMREFSERDIFPTLDQAKAEARARQAKYEADCLHAEMCR